MRVCQYLVDPGAWTTAWVPLSYKVTKNATEYRWGSTGDLIAIARVYPQSAKRVVLGDLWLHASQHGKVLPDGRKVSVVFLGRVLAKAATKFPGARLELHVDGGNIPAIRLYQRLGFRRTGSKVGGRQVWVLP